MKIIINQKIEITSWENYFQIVGVSVSSKRRINSSQPQVNPGEVNSEPAVIWHIFYARQIFQLRACTSLRCLRSRNFQLATHLGTSRRDLSLSVYTLENWSIYGTIGLCDYPQKSNQLKSWGLTQGTKNVVPATRNTHIHTRGLDPEASPCDKSLSVRRPFNKLWTGKIRCM